MAKVAKVALGEAGLFLDLAKDAFRRQIAKRVRPLARSYVERWMGGEFWLYTSVVSRHRSELRAYRDVVLETLRSMREEDMLAICRKERPDLDDLWSKPAARERLKQERERAIEFVQGL